jgi:3',5'-cyclic AMP phosphodiesterase CpdA
MTRKITRRQVLGELVAGAGLLAAGCAGNGSLAPDPEGSTLRTTYRDSHGTGVVVVARGEPLRPRTELGPPARGVGVLATIAHLTDAHVLDAQSPARVTFLDRLGVPFESTFRPQETLTTQVLTGALYAVRALHPNAVIQGGDLIDNDQSNELEHALAALNGGTVSPGSGGHGYFGVQSAFDADPFYYRPDLDAPLHPGLLQAATRPFRSPGVGRSWHPVLGDHDILVAGEIAPTRQTRALALGDEAVWDRPSGLTTAPGLGSVVRSTTSGAGFSPDGPPEPGLVERFLHEALSGPKVRVRPDRARRELDFDEVVRRLRAGSANRAPGARSSPDTGSGSLLDYSVDVGSRVRVVVLDLARRAGGSGGRVHPGQADWLAAELAGAGDRWVVVCSHQPLVSSEGGEQILGILDGNRRVIAAISGHVHRHRIIARRTPAGGYWLISTASLIDYPQQARALRVVETSGGGVAIETWVLDHVFPGRLGTISRQLAYLDAQGGRPQGLAGGLMDRNVTLYRA